MTDLRAATPDRWRDWRAVRLRALAVDPSAFGSTLAREEAYTEADWRRFCRPPATLVYDGARPVALASGFADRPGHLMVVAMWVEPAHRGQGLSHRMLDVVTGWAREQGLVPHLWVNTRNVAARASYLRYGFVPTEGSMELNDGDVAEAMVLPPADAATRAP